MSKVNIIDFGKNAIRNFLTFAKMMALIFISMALFGKENTLPAVCIAVAWLMFPESKLDIKPSVFIFNNFFLFLLGAATAQISKFTLIGAGIGYFLTTILILALSMAPKLYMPSIPYLLNFVFCQAMPVNNHIFIDRVLCLTTGCAFLSVVTLIQWHRKKLIQEQNGFAHQIKNSLQDKTYILKMAAGLTLAMVITDCIQPHKPLWISIVVMSLTEYEAEVMHSKIKDRIIGTFIGIILFSLIIGKILPASLVPIFIIVMGYVGFFFSGYRTKTVLNAISALNASLVIFDNSTAIIERVICLIAGIAIVILINLISRISETEIDKPLNTV